MSLASTRLQLIHEATVLRDTEGSGSTSWGKESPQWTTHIAALPCRVWTSTGRQAVDQVTTVVVEDMRLICPIGTDITAADRIEQITYRGDAIVPGPVGIRAVMQHKDHLELVLVQLGS